MFVLSICVYPELERLKQKVGVEVVERGQWALGEGWWDGGWETWGPEDQDKSLDSIIIDGFNVAFCTDQSQEMNVKRKKSNILSSVV